MRVKHHDLQQMVSTQDHGGSWRSLTRKIVSFGVFGNRYQKVIMRSREYAPRELLSEDDGVNVHRQGLTSNELRHLSQS